MESDKISVIFTEDAFNTILAETFHKDPSETGGILLGQIENNSWYVIECLEPGPASVFRSAYFEYDHVFVNYLAKARARRYEVPLWRMSPRQCSMNIAARDLLLLVAPTTGRATCSRVKLRPITVCRWYQ